MSKQVYSLENLETRALLDAGAAKPARLAVLGMPVAHSASPRMHQPALDEAGIDARYIRLEVRPGEVAEAIRRMRALGFIGCNVTVPHKREVMDASDEVDPAARALGAVNTVRFTDGGTQGFNTDALGFRRAVEEVAGKPLGEMIVVVAGAGGGAGQAVAAACRLAGTRDLTLANRSVDKLGPMVARLEEMACDRDAAEVAPLRIRALGLDDPDLPGHCRAADLIVNTSSLGLAPGDPSVLPAACLRPGCLVYDTIYQPPVTPLLALARDCGCRTANGLTMLLHQGAIAFEIWFPGTRPLATMRAALG